LCDHASLHLRQLARAPDLGSRQWPRDFFGRSPSTRSAALVDSLAESATWSPETAFLHRSIPHGEATQWEPAIDQIASERGYKNRDIINVTKEGLGDSYEAKLKMFFEVRHDSSRSFVPYDESQRKEHMHEDEEIRYVLSGSGFFDVRGDDHLPRSICMLPAHSQTLDADNTDAEWIRIAVSEGDLLVLP
jgi:cupin superfamily acireductone dioxygenase involved in methionine salvage